MIGYFLVGLRRSGNHLFINIIINNYKRVLFFNDINIGTNVLTNHLIRNGSEVIANTTLSSKLVNNLNDKPECIIFSFEDLSILDFDEMVNKINKRFNFTKIIKCIVIRDLLNCMASRLESNNDTLAPVNQDTNELWFSHFNSRLPKLNYNLFLIDNNYKEELKKILCLDKVEDINTVSLFFSGSSFNRYSTEKQSNIDYLTRYKKYFNEEYILNNNFKDIENYFSIKYT